jgi:hypothetical protein
VIAFVRTWLGVRHMIEDVGHRERAQERHSVEDLRHRLRQELDMPGEARNARRRGLCVGEGQPAFTVCLDAKTRHAAVLEAHQFRIADCGIEKRQAFEISIHTRQRIQRHLIVRAVGAAGNDDGALQT